MCLTNKRLAAVSKIVEIARIQTQDLYGRRSRKEFGGSRESCNSLGISSKGRGWSGAVALWPISEGTVSNLIRIEDPRSCQQEFFPGVPQMEGANRVSTKNKQATNDNRWQNIS